jgi:DNA-binding beta-propeller fold protein YncE
VIDYRRLNRLATTAILPLMFLTVAVAARHTGTTPPSQSVSPLHEGVLVTANLRDDSLAFHDLQAGGATSTLQLPGPPHELATVGDRMYATLGRGNALVEVAPAAPGILRTLSLDGQPHGLATDGPNLLVTLDTAAELFTVDRESLSVRSQAPTGDTPHIVVAAGSDVYVAAARANQVTDIRHGRSLDTGDLPEGLAIVGPYLLTTDNQGGTLTIVRRDGFALAGRVTLGGEPVRAVALDDHRALVALNGAGRVAVVDLETQKVERESDVDARPDGLCVSPSGQYVGVASNAVGTVTIFRISDWARAGVISDGPGLGSCLWLPGH